MGGATHVKSVEPEETQQDASLPQSTRVQPKPVDPASGKTEPDADDKE